MRIVLPKRALGILLIVYLTLSQALGAVDSVAGVPISGRVFTDVYAPLSNAIGDQWQQVSASLWLQADPKLGEFGSGHFTWVGNDIQTSSVMNVPRQFRSQLREGFVSYSKSGWDFKVGKLIIPWGKSDVINPTDFLSAKDYTFFNPDDEVKRIGAVSLWMNWTPLEGNSPFSFTGVFTPVFPQSQLLLAPGQIPTGIQVNFAQTTPTPSLANSEAALKVGYSGNQWDGSLLAFRGWNHLPIFQSTNVGGTLDNLNVNAIATFQRYWALGGDFSFTLKKWILRGESAYVWTENNNGQNPLIQPTHWDSVLGLERPLGNDFRIQGQVLMRYYPRFLKPELLSGSDPLTTYVNQQIAQTNALIQNYQDSVRPAFSLRFSYSNDESGLSSELFILTNWIGGDYLLRPQLTYAWTDSLKSDLGVDYYAGPKNRPLGVLSPYNSIYTEFRYLF